MVIKQQIKNGDIQKVCRFYNDIFHSIYLCHTLSSLLYHLPSPVLLKISNYGIRKIKIFCIYGYFLISRYIKGGGKLHKIALNTIAFLGTNVCVNNPY